MLNRFSLADKITVHQYQLNNQLPVNQFGVEYLAPVKQLTTFQFAITVCRSINK